MAIFRSPKFCRFRTFSLERRSVNYLAAHRVYRSVWNQRFPRFDEGGDPECNREGAPLRQRFCATILLQVNLRARQFWISYHTIQSIQCIRNIFLAKKKTQILQNGRPHWGTSTHQSVFGLFAGVVFCRSHTFWACLDAFFWRLFA